MLDLDAIAARAKLATPGPWATGLDACIRAEGRNGQFSVAFINPAEGLQQPNAIFVAAAREDVPALVAELRALRPMRELLIHIATDEILTDFQIERARNLLDAYDKVVG
jgi:hypothetical protein